MKHIRYQGGHIIEPGFFSHVSMARYHSADICPGPSVSSTGLRKIIKDSLKHFWNESPMNPRRQAEDEKEKRHFVMGRALHLLALGEAGFTKLFCEQPDTYIATKGKDKGKEKAWNANADACKDWAAERRAEGRTPLTPAEIKDIRGMMLALAKEPLVLNGLLNGAIERSGFWKDKRTGIWLKVRPDMIPQDSDDVVDAKISKSTAFEDLQRAISPDGYGYIQQGALVAEAWRCIFGRELNSFSLCFIEHKPPYDVRIVTLEPEDLKRGRDLNEVALGMLWKALKNQEWPGRAGVQRDAHTLALSQRQRERIDNILKNGVMN